MITAKKLREFLSGVPDDTDIYVPSRKDPDLWDELSTLQINYDDFGDYTMITLND